MKHFTDFGYQQIAKNNTINKFALKKIVGLLLLCSSASFAANQTVSTVQGVFEFSNAEDAPIKQITLHTKDGHSIPFNADQLIKKLPTNTADLVDKTVKVTFTTSKNGLKSVYSPLTVSIAPTDTAVNGLKTRASSRQTQPIVYKYNEPIYGNKVYNALLCRYKDSRPVEEIKTNQSIVSPEYVMNILNESNTYWKIASFNQFNIDNSKVFGWYTLNTKKYYADLGTKEDYTFKSDCMNAAIKDGFNADSPYGIILIQDTDSFLAYGSKGEAALPAKNDKGTYGGTNFDGTPVGRKKRGGFIHISSFLVLFDLFSHELGHSIGLNHSFYYDTNNKDLPPQYANVWDVMSRQGAINNQSKPQFPNTYNRYRLGWLNAKQVVKYELKTPAQTVVLTTSSRGAQPINYTYLDQRLVILKNTYRPLTDYSIEVRGAEKGIFSVADQYENLVTAPVVIIHKHVPNLNPYLLQQEGHLINSVVNPGKDKTFETSFNNSVMLTQGESWVSDQVSERTKLVYKVTVDKITKTGATITVSSVPIQP